MSMLTNKELLALKKGTSIYAAYPSEVNKCELYSSEMVGSIWGNLPEELVINLSGIGLLYGDECTDLYLCKEEAMVRAKEWEIENRKEEVSRWEVEYKKALDKLNSPIEVVYEE
ncbi:conserved hypothetical protein [Vibrio phage 249E41-1]|nr:conserved hypothetical protein [Vibrio phage 249E41-1]CAH9017541.1 conserved hypothetical protein [Vibrio phage 193E37-1]